jgi:glycosyltransferase involved in cell wall biosynthesis
MRVGLNLLYLVPGATGGRETYARELVPELLALEPDLELIAFVNRDAGPGLGDELSTGVRAVEIGISATGKAQWALGELALVARAARRAHVDVLHSMANFGPPSGSFRRVVTIHDLQYRALPQLLSATTRAATAALVGLAARRSDRIIAVSGAGRDEIVTGLGVDVDRVDVVANGVRPAPPAPATDGVRERYQLGQGPIVLAVATNLPHKNLPALIDALALIDAPQRPMLALAGHGTHDGSLRARADAAGVAEHVRALGGQSREELESLYALADCLVLPTLHEGFGLPVLEAMARGVPVACSDVPALREVAGDAALLFDPHAPAQIAARVQDLLCDPALAERLRAAGRLRAAAFSWSAAARGTLASYRSALGG